MQAASPASGRAFSRSNARSIAGASRSGVWLQVKVHPPVSGVWCASHYTSCPGQLEHPFERSGRGPLRHLSFCPVRTVRSQGPGIPEKTKEGLPYGTVQWLDRHHRRMEHIPAPETQRRASCTAV